MALPSGKGPPNRCGLSSESGAGANGRSDGRKRVHWRPFPFSPARVTSNRSVAPWLCHPPRTTIPAGLYPWLTDPGSLTARIRARCGVFAVRVLNQGLAPPHRDEAAALGIAPGVIAWQREVVLLADGVPVVYARTLMSRDHLRGPWNRFTGLGNRPLGAALFADPRILRQPLRLARLDRRDPRFQRAAAVVPGSGKGLWARRSLFGLDGRALLVCEVFLPAILDLASQPWVRSPA
ncbi:MAG: chorismate lyase [Zoogloeaceae bacterium]|nr:chorismate lyase [Zoogloeaceae bacterium]